MPKWMSRRSLIAFGVIFVLLVNLAGGLIIRREIDTMRYIKASRAMIQENRTELRDLCSLYDLLDNYYSMTLNDHSSKDSASTLLARLKLQQFASAQAASALCTPSVKIS